MEAEGEVRGSALFDVDDGKDKLVVLVVEHAVLD